MARAYRAVPEGTSGSTTLPDGTLITILPGEPVVTDDPFTIQTLGQLEWVEEIPVPAVKTQAPVKAAKAGQETK